MYVSEYGPRFGPHSLFGTPYFESEVSRLSVSSVEKECAAGIFRPRQEQNPQTRSEEGRYFGEIGNIYNLVARGVI